MNKFILCGKYNNLYKYIWLYLVIEIIYDYFFGKDIPDELKIDYLKDFPENILIQEIMNYLGTTLFSFILWKYQKRKSKSKIIPMRQSESTSYSLSLKEPSLLHNKYTIEIEPVSGLTFLYIILLLIFSNQLKKIFNVFGLKGLDFWMFELVFICVITSLIFKVQIYRHKKLSIIII